MALVLGDPAGIGPELVARLLARPDVRERGDVLLIGDRDEFRRGLAIAGVEVAHLEAPPPISVDSLAGRLGDLLSRGQPVLCPFRGAASGPFPRAQASAEGGRYALDTLALALELVGAGQADALCFAPLNKSALKLAGMKHPDELHWFAERLGWTGPVGELNVLDGLWTSRVTSHVALKEVSGLLTPERVAEAITLIDTAVRQAGVTAPRIAVCGLNPHNGDHGTFGREEIDVIEPGLALARARGRPADGPFPADTIFLKARDGLYDAVVTMYHDQGQIALKLMGFDRGVTVQGGLPIPITTPAHGTAFDIAGRGTANPGALGRAFELACLMGARRRTAG